MSDKRIEKGSNQPMLEWSIDGWDEHDLSIPRHIDFPNNDLLCADLSWLVTKKYLLDGMEKKMTNNFNERLDNCNIKIAHRNRKVIKVARRRNIEIAAFRSINLAFLRDFYIKIFASPKTSFPMSNASKIRWDSFSAALKFIFSVFRKVWELCLIN